MSKLLIGGPFMDNCRRVIYGCRARSCRSSASHAPLARCPTKVMVNAQDVAPKAALQKFVRNEWQLIAFFSQKLTPSGNPAFFDVTYSTSMPGSNTSGTSLKFTNSMSWHSTDSLHLCSPATELLYREGVTQSFLHFGIRHWSAPYTC